MVLFPKIAKECVSCRCWHVVNLRFWGVSGGGLWPAELGESLGERSGRMPVNQRCVGADVRS